ncbi:MAG: 2,3-bisphosphoglycerate-independent phosphoglycerate mutase [Clostridiales bacterium]|jgi:2,3-bisphosphoglycerate-independent phosphoglycerate mutase|nr:2,3-bisphosphoglycerate-independent phosphoglycerate mutase [Clostridiales bacterium]
MSKKITALLILDGFGYTPDTYGNAVRESGIPFISAIKKKYPYAYIKCSGEDVGLPKGQMGNSEVGHTNIGAGRIVFQELVKISKAIEDGAFFENREILAAVDSVKKNGGSLHLMGLLSDGGVHSHIDHLFALLRLAKKRGVKETFVHCFLDGRDVPPSSGREYIVKLENYMKEISYGRIATVTGRYYAMDRDNRWERVEKAYKAIADGDGLFTESAENALALSAATDEFVVPAVVIKDGKPIGEVRRGDSVIFYNFRPDRAREITRAFTEEGFEGFKRKKGLIGVNYVCFTQYDAKFAAFPKLSVAFKPQSMTNLFGGVVAQKGLKQLRIAETEKYAHVTFFFNGGVEEPFEGQDNVLIPSPKVETYDQKPEMSAYEVADKAVGLIKSGKYDVMILNFANCDMVGHTGVMTAAVKAVGVVDECTKRVVEAVLATGGVAVITADHGNAEKMYEADGSPYTAHTVSNPVPFIVVGAGENVKLRQDARLADIAPTLLKILGIEKPAEMTGESIIVC